MSTNTFKVAFLTKSQTHWNIFTYKLNLKLGERSLWTIPLEKVAFSSRKLLLVNMVELLLSLKLSTFYTRYLMLFSCTLSSCTFNPVIINNVLYWLMIVLKNMFQNYGNALRYLIPHILFYFCDNWRIFFSTRYLKTSSCSTFNTQYI